METIIVFRNSDGSIGITTEDENGEPYPFASKEKAIKYAESSEFLQSRLHQIVELNEL